MKSLPKNYDHKITETKWQEHWVTAGTYHFKDDSPREQTFVIDTPPPTVSGILHMGHIFSYTQADFIARYQRMSGKDVFYPMGFDDNGLPTERLVEKTKSVRGSSMPRADFVALCKEVVVDAENEFRRLFKSAALSVDWRKEYQTINENVQAISQASFVDLMEKDQAYRAFRPTYWDWVDQTAIAQAEIEEKEQQGIQITIPFGIMDASDWNAGKRPTFDSLEKVYVMTTRPELLGACVALMVHPDDKDTYKEKIAVSPLFNVVVPICFDEKVDKEKGTGFVMCCSWGDDTDKEWIAKHNLAWRPLIDRDGRIRILGIGSDQEIIGDENATAVIFIAGRDGKNGEFSHLWERNCLDVKKALGVYRVLENSKLIRDVKNENSAKGKALKLLDEAGLLIAQGDKQEKVIHKIQMVKCAERSGTPIEIIPTHQWFVKLVDKKEALLTKGAAVNWHPEYMRVRLNQWIEGLKEDWCISRQRFFGVPFPVWYLSSVNEDIVVDKTIYAKKEQLPVDPLVDIPNDYTLVDGSESPRRVIEKSTGKEYMLFGDKDVMDTWATSSVSPQINAGGIKISDERLEMSKTAHPSSLTPHPKLLPADLRPQAHEIIRTWAFYTIAKAHLHMNDVPWKNIMISGWCLAADKTKMSKSKGNVVTPVDLIEEKGTDAVRYWASTSRLAADTAFSEDLLKIGKKLVGKIWNASQFAAINFDKLSGTPTTAVNDKNKITEALDLWILSRLHMAVTKATKAFEEFEYSDARVAIEDFFWNDFCDNYLELVKSRAYEGETAKQQSALYAIYHCLETLLRLFAPLVPHVTEEIYSHLFEERYAILGSVHARGAWPKAADYPYDVDAERAGIAAVDVLNMARKAKSEAGVSIKFPIDVMSVEVTGVENGASLADLARVEGDLLGAANAKILATNPPEKPVNSTDKGWFLVSVQLAASADS